MNIFALLPPLLLSAPAANAAAAVCPPVANFVRLLPTYEPQINDIEKSLNMSQFPQLAVLFSETDNVVDVIIGAAKEFNLDKLWAKSSPELKAAFNTIDKIMLEAMYESGISTWDLLSYLCANENGGSYPSDGSITCACADQSNQSVKVSQANKQIPVCVPMAFQCDQGSQKIYDVQNAIFDIYECVEQLNSAQ